MGFFRKIFKGVKKVFKKIGSGIKKAVKKVGKFMGKLGIVGQIGLGLILPGIGSMMGSMFGSLAGALSTSSIGIVRGAGQVINAAVNIGTKAGNVFSSITEGVTKVVGEVAGATLNKLGVKNIGNINLSSKTFSGAWETAQTAISDVAASGRDLFRMDTLTGANKYLTQSAIEAGDAALEGIDIESSYTDAMLDDIPQTMQPGFTPQESVIEQGLNLPTAQATSEQTLAEAVDSFRAAQEATTGVSTAAAQTTAQPSLLSQATTRAKEALVSAPERVIQTAATSLATTPRDAIIAAVQGAPEVSYNIRQGVIPDISGIASIGQEYAQPSFDPSSYFNQNEMFFNQNPYGFGARLYNDATYQRNMAAMGFQVPMYGMG